MNIYQKAKRCAKKGMETFQGVCARLEQCKAIRAVLFFAVMFFIGVSMYLLNVHMPVILDDFDFAISWATGEMLSGLGDIIASQVVHYHTWGGRLVQFFSQLFMYWGDNVFNVVNTSMYLVLLLEIYMVVRPKRRFCWMLILLEHLVLINMIPFFGTVFLWMCGSCNYLFGTALSLLPLLVLRSVKDGGWISSGKFTAVLCFLIGVLGGWTNENMTCGVIALVFVSLVIDLLEKHAVSKRLIAMWIGQCIGALVLLLAPGNFARASAYTYDSVVMEFIRRGVMVTAYGMSYLGLLLGAALLLGASLKDIPARKSFSGLLAFGAVIGAYALVGSPELSDRAFTGPFVLALCAVLVFVADVQEHQRHMDWAWICVLPLVMVTLFYTSYHAFKEVKNFEAQWQKQISSIEQAIDEGKTQAFVESVESHSRFTMDILFADDANTWPNTSISRVYGIDVIGR